MRPRTPTEEKTFRQALADYWRGIGPERVPVRDRRTGKTIYVLPDQDATPAPACPTCAGRGWIMRDAATPSYCPDDCAAAQALRGERLATLYQSARLPREYQGLTLDSFYETCQRQPAYWNGKKLGYEAMRRWIAAAADEHMVDAAALAAHVGGEAHEDWRNWLVLSGPRGVGKTGLVAAAVNALVAEGRPVRYTRTQDFLKAVQDRYGAGRDEYVAPRDEFVDVDSGGVIDLVRKTPVLLLDEFDVADSSGNKQAIMENVIRYRHGELLPTVLTTNLDQREMEARWGATTVSVILQRAHWIPMGGLPLRAIPQRLERSE